jgi:hypothetical protein
VLDRDFVVDGVGSTRVKGSTRRATSVQKFPESSSQVYPSKLVTSIVFYNEMLNGKTLAKAASAALASPRNLGDASWLAKIMLALAGYRRFRSPKHRCLIAVYR